MDGKHKVIFWAACILVFLIIFGPALITLVAFTKFVENPPVWWIYICIMVPITALIFFADRYVKNYEEDSDEYEDEDGHEDEDS